MAELVNVGEEELDGIADHCKAQISSMPSDIIAVVGILEIMIELVNVGQVLTDYIEHSNETLAIYKRVPLVTECPFAESS